MRGQPRCEFCHGKGVTRTSFGWRVCHCVRGTAEQARLQQLAHAPRPGDMPPCRHCGSSEPHDRVRCAYDHAGPGRDSAA